MAVIDVDRHILTKLIEMQLRIKTELIKYQEHWDNIIEVRDKTEALFTPPIKGDKKDFRRLRDKIFEASKACQMCVYTIAENVHKQDALLVHLVSEVGEVDTKKGQESILQKVLEGTNGATNGK